MDLKGEGEAKRKTGVRTRDEAGGRRHARRRKGKGKRDSLGLQIEDLDTGGGGGTEPVSVGGEDEGVDDVSSLEGVEVLSVVEVPKHGDTVLSSGGSERTIGGDRDGVDVTGVSVVVGSELALGELPDLINTRTK